MCSSKTRNEAPAAESSEGLDREAAARSRMAGRKAGFAWAAEEARRGYLHPWRMDPARRMRIVINRARQAFHGRCAGERHSFLRGFVEGAAEFWESQIDLSASRREHFAPPEGRIRALLPGAAAPQPE